MLNRLKIGAKLGIGFGTVIVLAVLLGIVSLNRLSTMSHYWEDFEKVTLAKRTSVTAGSEALAAGVHHFKNFVLRGGDYARQFDNDMVELGKRMGDYRQLGAVTPKEDELLKKVAADVRNYQEAMKKLVDMKAGNASISELDKAVSGADKQIAASLNELREIVRARTKDASTGISDTLAQSRTIVLALAVALAVLGIACAWLITRSITKPLNEAVHVAQKVADGDLTVEVEVKSKDETGQLLQALKDMNDSLRRIVGEVRTGTEAIGSASKQIASGNADLSQRTEEQASSLEETASSMEELTSTVKQNADNARQANQLAASASAVAVKGGDVVGQVVGTMTSINESSKKIVDIISVIDGIAFQTNILALNAAVEAARAGEQGRGFAVVASEVRSLAQRSAAAAKEIKELITDSVSKVENGTQLVDEAGKTMDEIVASVKRVTDIMAEISAASQEQSSGIEQVNQAVTQMDEVTQQNAALVEEAAAAAESLQEQAQNLTQAVAVFKLAHGMTAANTAPLAKSAATVTALPVKAKARPAAAPLAPVTPKKVANSKAGDDEWEQF